MNVPMAVTDVLKAYTGIHLQTRSGVAGIALPIL